jgi:hypothetical protein
MPLVSPQIQGLKFLGDLLLSLRVKFAYDGRHSRSLGLRRALQPPLAEEFQESAELAPAESALPHWLQPEEESKEVDSLKSSVEWSAESEEERHEAVLAE